MYFILSQMYRRQKKYLDFEVETTPLNRVGTNLAVGDSHMVGMCGITLQGFFTFEGTVKHHVGIRRGQTTIDMNLHVEESGHLAHESFQTGLDIGLHLLLLFFREFRIQARRLA